MVVRQLYILVLAELMPLELPIFVRNLNECVMFCKQHDGGLPHRRCIYNGRDIQDNAADGDCQHPAGTRYTRPPPNVVQGELVFVGLTRDELWKTTGPQMWGELHVWTRTARLSPPDTAWLTNWLSRIMCGDCKRDALKWVADHPPDWGNREGLFEWGCSFHNYVNSKLGKPIMSVEDAVARWGE